MYIETKIRYLRYTYKERWNFFMKKKYVAVMLGLVLSMSTASVYAAGSSATAAAGDADSTG